MKASSLMNPRFEVVAEYPNSNYKVGQIVNCTEVFLEGFPESHFVKYPHLFRKLKWWEHRRVEEMPKRLICKAIEGDTEVIEIEEWDMDLLYGWVNKSKRECCSLESFNPEYGYFPVD